MVRRSLLGCGPASSLLYLLSIDVVARRRHPEYHRYTSQMVSELFAVGSPTRRLLLSFMVPYNLLVFAFAGGVWASAGPRRVERFTALTLAAYGVSSTAGGLCAPMDVRGTLHSRRDRRHILVTMVMSLFIVATMVLGAFTRGRRFRLYSLGTAAFTVAFGGLAGYLARPMPRSTPGVGLAERVNIYLSMTWFAVFALVLWRPRGPQARERR